MRIKKTVNIIFYMAQILGEKEGEGIRIPLLFAHRELASWIGTTRETASLQVESLLHKGIIAYRRRQLIIPSFRKLAAEVKHSHIKE